MSITTIPVSGSGGVSEAPQRVVSSLPLQLCWCAVFVWLPLFWLSVATPHGSTAAAISGALQGLLLVAIVLLHATICYGWRGSLAYLLIATVVTFALEANSIANGFPFGYYVHHGAPGPAPLGVPVSVMAGYVVFGWFAWMLAKLIVCRGLAYENRFNIWLVPVIGGLIFAGFDYPYDPIGSTVRQWWSFRDPGGQFGVPLTNYLGWIFTGWAIFALFGQVELRLGRPADRCAGATVRSTTRFWAIPMIVWIGFATQYPVLYVLAAEGSVELAGSRYRVEDIFEASLAASLFTLVFVSLLALGSLFAICEAQQRRAAASSADGL